jgi:ubiquitin C-terminal hydrolase
MHRPCWVWRIFLPARQDAKREIKLKHLPDVLYLHLLRFTQVQQDKVALAQHLRFID